MATGDETEEKLMAVNTYDTKIELTIEGCSENYRDCVKLKRAEAASEGFPVAGLQERVFTEGDRAEESGGGGTAVSKSTCSAESPAEPVPASEESRSVKGERDAEAPPFKHALASGLIDSMRLGIEHTITAGPTSESDRDLLMQDFMTVESTVFSSDRDAARGGRNRFLFKTYAPTAFRYFRELFGIKPDDFLKSFRDEPLRELSDSGKSGSSFYLTGDGRFIVKTMQSKECSFLQKLLPGYYLNLHQNPDTLLPKYFGLYCYDCDVKKVKLVAMNNILPSNALKMDVKYDLKGATYKSRATRNAPGAGAGASSSLTYKDLDFLAHHPTGLFLDGDTHGALMKTIKRDCTVLESFQIMDYSLLLGIAKVKGPLGSDSEKRRSSAGTAPKDAGRPKAQGSPAEEDAGKPGDDRFPRGGLPAMNGEGEPLLIFVGIIDILQSYKFKKKVEHALKSILHDSDTISVHRPGFYSLRFQKFMAEKVFKKLSPPVKRKGVKQTCAKSPACGTPSDKTVRFFADNLFKKSFGNYFLQDKGVKIDDRQESRHDSGPESESDPK